MYIIIYIILYIYIYILDLDRRARDEDDVKVAEQHRVDERQVEQGIDTVKGVDEGVLHVPPHVGSAGVVRTQYYV
jgi:hypothetical protein